MSNAILAKRAGTIAHTLPDSLEDLHIHQQRQAEAPGRLGRTPHPEAHRRRLVRRLRPAQDRGDPRHRDHPRGHREPRRRRVLPGSSRRRGPGRGPDPPVPVLPLARRVPAHLPRTSGGPAEQPEGWSGGFSCVIGNPPWERVKLQEQEFFASRNPDIANAPNKAARKKLIAGSPRDRSGAVCRSSRASSARRRAGATSFARSDRYPLTGRGRR